MAYEFRIVKIVLEVRDFFEVLYKARNYIKPDCFYPKENIDYGNGNVGYPAAVLVIPFTMAVFGLDTECDHVPRTILMFWFSMGCCFWSSIGGKVVFY